MFFKLHIQQLWNTDDDTSGAFLSYSENILRQEVFP